MKKSSSFSSPANKNYGYLWWHRRPKAPIPSDMYSARGRGGQRVIVVPSLDLVVIRVGDSVNRKAKWDHQFMKLIVESIAAPAKVEKSTKAKAIQKPAKEQSESKKLYSIPPK